MFNQTGSRRWTHFHSALQLAIQRSARKWTFEDFAECFPLYVEQDKLGAMSIFSSISDYIETQNFRDLDKLFKDYDVRQSIDLLHKVVNEAKERKARGDPAPDAWKEDIDPLVVVRARTVSILESEVARLGQAVDQAKLENRELQKQLQQNIEAKTNVYESAAEILGQLDAVNAQWQKVPLEDIEAWMAQTEESLKPLTHD